MSLQRLRIGRENKQGLCADAANPSSNRQIGLFDDGNAVPGPASEMTSRRRGKALLHKLYAIRADLDTDEFWQDIEHCIVSVRNKIRGSDDERLSAILFAIEKQHATTLGEIMGDTNLARSIVEPILAELLDSGTLYKVPRLIPGSGRTYYMIKSRREPVPEVNGSTFAPRYS